MGGDMLGLPSGSIHPASGSEGTLGEWGRSPSPSLKPTRFLSLLWDRLKYRLWSLLTPTPEAQEK